MYKGCAATAGRAVRCVLSRTAPAATHHSSSSGYVRFFSIRRPWLSVRLCLLLVQHDTHVTQQQTGRIGKKTEAQAVASSNEAHSPPAERQLPPEVCVGVWLLNNCWCIWQHCTEQLSWCIGGQLST